MGLAVGAVSTTLLLLILGTVVTSAFSHPDESWDGTVLRWLAEHRTAVLDWGSATGSALANTQTVVAVGLVAFVALRLWLGRWRESWLIAAAVLGELWIFLVVTAVVERARPDVAQLDAAPPTSSFPSGHTAAAVALYGSLALVIMVRLGAANRHRWWLLVLFAVPVIVGAARLYRGMHFLSDVVCGLLGGALWLAVVMVAFGAVLRPEPIAGEGSASPSRSGSRPPGPGTASREPAAEEFR